MRHIGDVVVAGPSRATAQEASVDATGFAKATTSCDLEKSKDQIAYTEHVRTVRGQRPYGGQGDLGLKRPPFVGPVRPLHGGCVDS